ncbi:hypothetical protein GQ43DRAFT_213557 [Delitschia confertaspora ATCC 74209]|uniref:Uncharacterized protein n=1 Tax=Delitschia confertaspora ATCC 74209 TaxID=1513339 RepID=A0A9P4JDG0_9PLEO|nr:hypothetical protein GQ43DRAFT_213557 [Delitschia confertaspora ATCC 74209]
MLRCLAFRTTTLTPIRLDRPSYAVTTHQTWSQIQVSPLLLSIFFHRSSESRCEQIPVPKGTPLASNKGKLHTSSTGKDSLSPATNFRELVGGSRPIYYGLIVVLTIFGTIESIFWLQFITRRFFPSKDREERNG